MVIANSSANAEDSGMEPREGQLNRWGLGECYGLNCVLTKIRMMES